MKNDTVRSAMDFFILAAISRGGLHSLYELQHGVALQPGGIHPVLKRLEAEGLLERSEQQKRRRRLMTVTKRGEEFLDDEWQNCLRQYQDVESILRAATVAVLMGHRNSARDYLMGTADYHAQNVPVSPGIRQATTRSPVELYSFMRWQWECKRRESAASAFREIAQELEEMKRS
jgi:DNA-binding MarR family transcriptional regulator